MTTSQRQGLRGPTVVTIEAGSCGLSDAGFALCHQITTLDRSKLTTHVGSLREETLIEIEDAILAALDIERTII